MNFIKTTRNFARNSIKANQDQELHPKNNMENYQKIPTI